jgi:hypothetical protein
LRSYQLSLGTIHLHHISWRYVRLNWNIAQHHSRLRESCKINELVQVDCLATGRRFWDHLVKINIHFCSSDGILFFEL